MSAGPAPAATICDVDSLVAAHKTAVAAGRKRDYPAYVAGLHPLAEMGFGPAQRRLAVAYSKGLNGTKDPAEAYFWVQRAFRAGDAKAAKGVRPLGRALTDVQRANVEQRVAEWRPTLPDCWNTQRPEVSETGEHRHSFDGYQVDFDPEIPNEWESIVLERFPDVMRGLREGTKLGPFVFAVVDRIEVLGSTLYDRYVGFKPGTDEDVLQVSAANFLDKKPDAFLGSIVVEAARRISGKVANAPFRGPWERSHKRTRLSGSPYPDADNKAFYEAAAKALDMAAKLPDDLRRTVDVVDEIRYNPASEYFTKAGTLDLAVGFYDARLGQPGRRVIFIRRDMRYSSALHLLMTIVHEGTHALQDKQAEDHEVALAGLRSRLENLEAAGKGADAKAAGLRREIADRDGYVSRFRDGKIKDGRAESLVFECEALVNEINTARLFDAEPSSVQSGYLDLCDDAKILMVRWQDERLKTGLKKAR